MEENRLDCIGIAEYRSVAAGIAAADEMLKASSVKLIYAVVLCPGKYVVMISGNIGAVTEAIRSGERGREEFFIDSCVLADIDEKVLEALSGTVGECRKNTIGILETLDATSALRAANRIVKAVDVDLYEIRLSRGMGGKCYVFICGDISSVTEGIAIGKEEAGQSGALIAGEVIPNASQELFM